MQRDENVMLIPTYLCIPTVLYFNSVAASFMIFVLVKMSMGDSGLGHFIGPNMSLIVLKPISLLSKCHIQYLVFS